MNLPLEHEHAAGGSPLYQITAEHLAAVFALGVLLAGVWLLRRNLTRLFVPSLAPTDWLLAGLLAGSAAIHAGLAIGHDDHAAGLRALFLVDAFLLAVIARRVLSGGRAGRLGVAVLVGSIGAYWLSAVGGEAPDQVGLATKLGEILALAIVVRPVSRRGVSLRGFAGSVAITLLVIGTAASSWVGAFRASAAEPGAVAGHHVHAGSVAPPGTILPVVEEREPTPAERAAAADLIQAARIALARYADPAVAAADGYRVKGLAGLDFHAGNPAHENDDRVLDPAHPETLVYAVAPDGRPVLMGAMFMMPKIGTPGPTIGGPLTVWHAHEHVCFSLTPPALAGLLSPLGMCPLGTIDVPLTAEMIHIWIVPGAPEPFGDLDEAWKRAYLEAMSSRP
ncbi:MAG TPA: hypothetical protein VJ726_08930 [Candidatus Limnocylindria bacterium]|nr:hypothetical protein [Candidatus Limnocylindria bacterium]